MNTFAGIWTDGDNTEINVTGGWNVVSVSYKNGRGPFQGYSANLAAETITVNFTDDSEFTGVLSGEDILWSNGTKWTRKEVTSTT